MRYARATTAALLLLASTASALAGEPANPAANAQARAILSYIEALPRKAERRLISGQFAGYGPGASMKDLDATSQATGHWPAMIGLDYCDFSTGGLHTKAVDRLAIDYARAGGLVTISTHLPNPANPKGGGLRDKGVDLETLLTPGHENHARWMRELDALADGLAELRDAGVIVQWRPFHEMNGNWFWWGGQDPAAFIRIWRHMFEHFTVARKLDNLLWVYSPNHGSKVAAYYPGNRFVDLVGLDAYTDHVDPGHIRGYREALALSRPFGFTEFGPHGPSDPPGDYDYTRLVAGVRAEFPEAAFFLAWHDNWGLGRNRNTKALLADPWVVNREDVPPALAARKP